MIDSVKNVTKHRLTVGSGIDDIADSKVVTRLDEYGQYTPDYSDSNGDKTTKILLNSDESRNEDEIAKTVFDKIPSINYNDKLGYYLGLYVGHVSEGSYRKNGSSGGMVTWVATQLLAQKEIDGFIHVKKSKKAGLLFEYGISRTPSEIQNGAKSRYYPAQLAEVLKEVKKTPGKYAAVGIPEIITELRLLAENDKIISERIKYYFGLVCGHQKTTKYAEAIAWEYGIKPGDLEDIDFRVKRRKGPAGLYDMRITGKPNGERVSYRVGNLEPFVARWAHGFFKARFSDFTDNSFNEVADITFGDAWLEEYESDPKGTNIVITRNKKLDDILEAGAKQGDLDLNKVNEETILRSQSGLIHHTRDELPYRLYKEKEKTGWAPKKRVEPSNTLDIRRKQVQDIREEIAEKSHEVYRKAVELDDFEYFKDKMKPLVDEYTKLYSKTPEKKFEKLREIIREKEDYSEAEGAILTLTGYHNYGNVVQRYALQKYLQKHGHKFVSYVDPHSTPYARYKIGRKMKLKKPLRAIKRFLNYQKPYWYTPAFGEVYPEASNWDNVINFVNRNIWIKLFDPDDKYKTYIVGSDQVWRDWWQDKYKLGYYYMDFLKGRKAKRIAYAASFGHDKIKDIMRDEFAEYVKPFVRQFDSVSVREKTGIKILEDVWGVKGAKEVADPTLLLEASDYSELIDDSDSRYEEIQPIFTYNILETPEIVDFVKRVQDERQQATRGISIGGDKKGVLPPVEFWLKGFRDADLVITNSFHGMMFSVINNTNFIVIGREDGGLSRIKDFLDTYGIEGRFVDENKLASFDIKNMKDIDWESVNKKLYKVRAKSGDWLLDAVNNVNN